MLGNLEVWNSASYGVIIIINYYDYYQFIFTNDLISRTTYACN